MKPHNALRLRRISRRVYKPPMEFDKARGIEEFLDVLVFHADPALPPGGQLGLRELLDRYGSPGVFAAYNAGPSRYEEHLAGGSLPDETRAYVAKLANLLAVELPPRWTSGGQSSAAATLFVTRSDLMKTRDRLLALMPSSGVTTAFSAPDVSPMVPRPIGMFVPRSDSGVSR